VSSQLFDDNCRKLVQSKLILNDQPEKIIELFKTQKADLSESEKLSNIDLILHGRAYHSRRDPERETLRQADDLRARGAHYIIHLSPGLGYLPRQLKIDMQQLVCDFDLEAIIKSLYWFEWPSSVFLYFIEDWRTEDLEPVLPFLQGKNIQKMLSRVHPPAITTFSEELETLKGRLDSLMEKRSINQATLIKFQELWNQNYLKNLAFIPENGTMKGLLQHITAETIIIAGAGPSLSISADILRGYRENFFLIAADTAFIPLAERGIFPDLCIAADPQVINSQFVYHPKVAKSAWLLDPVVCSQLVRHLHNQKALIYFWNSTFRLDSYVQGLTEDRGDIMHGGSVATNAFDLARKTKAKQIYLVGQDLSFPDSTAHVKGAALESQVIASISRLKTAEQHNFRQMSAMPKEAVPPILEKDKGKLFSNGKLEVFRTWFSRQSILNQDSRIRNATARGAVIPNLEMVDLEVELKSAVPVDRRVPIIDWSKSKMRPMILSIVEKLTQDVSELMRLYERNHRLAANDNQSARDRLAKNDAKIKKFTLANEFLSLAAQSLILSITETGANVSSEDFYGKMSHVARTQCRHLRHSSQRLRSRS
jgi:hypothetical protein